jgi:peptidoglycan lytic transglycosylase D
VNISFQFPIEKFAVSIDHPYNPNLRVGIVSPKTRTMLKKNLVKTAFFGQFLLLLIPNATAVRGETVVHQWGFRNGLPLHYNMKLIDSLARPDADSSSAFTGKMVEKTTLAAPQITLNKQAVKFVKGYMVKEEEALRKVKGRSKSYFRLIDTIFAKYGLPLEMKYLAVVESDLKSTALSKVGAKGMWQLMPSTARDLGLKVSKKYDERTQVYKSTVAAAKYLRDLYGYYGDWLLVLAAYNGGPGTVDRAIRKSGSRNFWVLQNFLPMESRGHVKRFIGTHYYFEGKGSITTLTKSEAIAFRKAEKEFAHALEEAEQASKEGMSVASANR